MSHPNPAPWPTAQAKVIARLGGHSGGTVLLAFSPDRGRLVSAGRDGSARLWDVGTESPSEKAALGPPGRRLGSLAFAPSGRFVAAGSGALDGAIWLYDVGGTAPLETVALRSPRGAVNAVAFSPDGTVLAAAGEDRALRLWDAAPIPRADPRVQLPGHTGTVRALAFAPDGQSLATASDDSTVRIWTVTRIRTTERIYLPHPAGVTAVAFTRDGQWLLTGGRDGVIRFWDPNSNYPVPKAELPPLQAGIRLLLAARDGQTLVSATDGPQVVHWDLPSRLPIREWLLPSGPPSAVAVTTDGRYLAAGRNDGAIELCRVAEKRG